MPNKYIKSHKTIGQIGSMASKIAFQDMTDVIVSLFLFVFFLFDEAKALSGEACYCIGTCSHTLAFD